MSALEELDSFLKNWTSTPVGRRAFLASVPVLLYACATTEHRQREGNLKGNETVLTFEDEKKMAANVMPEMLKDYPPIQSMELQYYIKTLGAKMVKANALEGNPYNYNFSLVGVSQVNAFALPAGTVFVTAPLLAMAETEAELAGVLGHELGHVKSRHTAQRIDRAQKEKGESWLYGVGGGVLGGAVGFGLGKLLCHKGDDGCVATATGLGAAAGVGGGLLVQKYFFMANSREDEMEADRIAFRTSIKTGYHRDHVGDFYGKLMKMEESRAQSKTPILSGLTDVMATHPPSKERVAQMEELRAHEKLNSKAITSSKDFDKAKKLAQEWVAQAEAKKA